MLKSVEKVSVTIVFFAANYANDANFEHLICVHSRNSRLVLLSDPAPLPDLQF